MNKLDALLQQAKDGVMQDEYYAYLQKLLASEEEKEPLIGHIKQEEFIRSDPSCEIICTIRLPPSMQALRMEESDLCREMRALLGDGGTGTTYHADLLSKTELVRSLMTDWIDEELQKRPDIKERLRGAGASFLIGKHWRLLVILVKA